jgi:hypothetical protein
VKGGGHLAILRNGLVETKESKVAVGDIVPVPGAQFEQTLASASPVSFLVSFVYVQRRSARITEDGQSR